MASWFQSRTIDNHLEAHTPQPDYELDQEWQWPFWKFGYDDPNVLFTTLHAEFNSVKCAIQDPYGWHHDVCDIANIAKDKNEFLILLKTRQNERFEEIQDAWEKTKALLTGEPSHWNTAPDETLLWSLFVRLARNFSYDSFVGYFGSYVTNDRPPNPPPPSTPAENRPARQQQPKESPGRKTATSTRITKRSICEQHKGRDDVKTQRQNQQLEALLGIDLGAKLAVSKVINKN
ncbi:uncharacterized protein N7496_006096 [Penicillium cataractarum]|uniref:Uncharacterized protein n=1 Tax=Penicillium cataractarum TaxID=2100454 RepID=A0A9W9S2T3_9EURO|nr:uncharacterized protein N7496_006096 [Penicillium cataractarum]KAJ5370004.1 hypothetical protein N7496_006096 [Penicillium cataractarum]